MKKILKISGVFIVILLLALFIAPFLLKDKIKEKVLEVANENLNATLSFDDLSVSFFKNFPNASVSLHKLSIINKEPFAGDTLVYAQDLSLALNVKDILFKAENEPYSLKSFGIENALVNIKFNKDEKGNFDIVKPSDTPEEASESTPISLKIQDYFVKNLRFNFKNEASNMLVSLDSLYHNGKGDFASEVLDLETSTKTKFSFFSDGNYLMKNAPLRLEAILGLDLPNQKYTFKDNSFFINDLELNFDGFVQPVEDGQNFNLNFKTPKTSFENFLNLIPKQYTKSIEGVKTSGNFTINGKVLGKYSENTIPTLDIQLLSQNASLKYPSLPKSIQNINIDVKIANETQKIDDTFVNINNFGFTIDQDIFKTKAKITNLLKNPNIWAKLKGAINLENIKKAYPVDVDLDLKGIFKADITTSFDMASVEKKLYQNIKNQGDASLENFVYSGAGFINPFNIEKAALNFNTSKIELTEFSAKTGKTDMVLKGYLDNFYGFVFKNEVLKGDFTMKSQTIAVSDFMQTSSEETPQSTENKEVTNKNTPTETPQIKVPAFLDCTFQASANQVLYDNLSLKNVTGKLIVKDEKVKLENLQTELFNGKVAVSGDVSTKEKQPSFNVNLDISKLNIVESFTHIEMLSKIAPVAKVLQGFFNSKIEVSGLLKDDFSPDLNSIKGNLRASFQDALIKKNSSELITSLEEKFPKLNITGIDLNKIKANLTFNDGKVNLAPIDVNLFKGGTAKVSGSHGFDQSINYNILLDVPPSMLGGEVESTLAKLSATEQSKLGNIPLNIGLTGNFDKPKVSADLASVAKNLATQIVKNQANKALDTAVDKVLGEASKNETVNNVINNILGGGKTQKDSTKTNQEQKKDQVKQAVGNILGGFLNRKKDTTSQKK